MMKKTDYQTELERIENTIAELEGNAFVPPADTEKLTTYVSGLYQRAVLTGNLGALEATQAVIDEAIRQLRLPGDLYFLKAKLAFQLHRRDDVRRNLAAAPSLPTSAEGRALLADVDFQEGRYREARTGYESVLADNRTWDNLARLAHFEAKLGDPALADRLYWEAEDELTAKQMRSYAWVELQRGLLDLAPGRHDDAAVHYRRADQAYSGYWLVAEHMAELLASQGELAQAAALYEDVVAQVPRPDLQQALAQLYTLLGRHVRARSCRVMARAAYLQSVRRGGGQVGAQGHRAGRELLEPGGAGMGLVPGRSICRGAGVNRARARVGREGRASVFASRDHLPRRRQGRRSRALFADGCRDQPVSRQLPCSSLTSAQPVTRPFV